MTTREIDVAIIGTGSAGMTAYRSAVAHTDSVLLIEAAEYGTTCARVGCMPSKLLIAAADAAHHVTAAPGFGVHGGSVRVDGAAVMQRVRAERDRFVGFVTEAVDAWPQAHRRLGRVRFLDAHTLEFDDGERIHARRIVIASGSVSIIPEDWRLALGDRLITNDDVFAWQALPASVAVVGAGVIALELGQALHRLGVRVRVFDRGGRFGGLSDPEVIAAARRVLAEDFPLTTGAVIDRVTRAEDGVRIDFQHQGATHSERYDYLLAALGRAPDLAHLNLGATGLPLDPRGVPISDPSTGQIGDSHVFIAGDASARRMLLHEAADEGRIAGDNAGRFPDVREHSRRTGLAVAFTDPQIAVAGASHAELLASGRSFEIAELDFSDQGRSRVMRRNRGLLRVYGEHHSDLFLGAEMIAPDGEHLAHLLAWAVHAKMTVQQMLDAPFYHPVVEEGVRTALRHLQRQLRMGPPPVPHCMDCGPGA
ncbi:MAG: dihydrolipoyl dehydrogenase [Lysobacterales bacterium]